MKKTYQIVLFIFLLGIWSCDVEDCISTKKSSMTVQFYSAEYDIPFPMAAIRGWAESNDSILFDTVYVEGFNFQLNPATNSTKYFIDYQPYEIDTVQFDPVDVDTTWLDPVSRFFEVGYDRRQRIITPDCGVEQSFYNLEILDHDFPGIIIENDTVDRYIEVNAKIYF